ncbi:hypothetical protein Fmac_013888 [Flemingia macrophylla]|uniref:Protein kish n=1 Tax=Flemingia macrophylla TaxID=520843 RepID=A0ABD1MC58_9FABA
MSALFNFHSFLTVILLGICACTYFKMQFPAILDQKTGFRGFFWKAARIGRCLLFDLLLFCKYFMFYNLFKNIFSIFKLLERGRKEGVEGVLKWVLISLEVFV